MPLNLSDKKQVVAEVADIASRAHSAVAADYRGLTVGQMTELRDKAREAGVRGRSPRGKMGFGGSQGAGKQGFRKVLRGPLRSS